MNNEDKIFTIHDDGMAIAYGSIEKFYKSVRIYADDIKLHQKDMGISIDISNEILSQIESIEINGFTFTKNK